MQIGHHDLAFAQYRYLIKQHEVTDQIVDDLQDLIEEADDPTVLQRLHRLLGDCYSRQQRYREAMAEYSWTFTS
jgi:hypothetical protein